MNIEASSIHASPVSQPDVPHVSAPPLDISHHAPVPEGRPPSRACRIRVVTSSGWLGDSYGAAFAAITMT